MIEILFSYYLTFQIAKVSWYDCCNVQMASGEYFNPDDIFVAHKTLPFGTKVLFLYEDEAIIAEVKDRGPYIKGREFDLSRGLAKKLRILRKGIAHVKYAIL